MSDIEQRQQNVFVGKTGSKDDQKKNLGSASGIQAALKIADEREEDMFQKEKELDPNKKKKEGNVETLQGPERVGNGTYYCLSKPSSRRVILVILLFVSVAVTVSVIVTQRQNDDNANSSVAQGALL